MTETASEGAIGKKERGCLCHICHLPVELLLMILSHLSALDYIYFRATCKCWRSAFSKCSEITFQNKANKQLPWFLILNAEQPKKAYGYSYIRKPWLHTTGKFGDLSTKRIYNSNIPELSGTRIMLSKYGWLLLFSSEGKSRSLFFFNLFSRSRISLPFLDVSELDRPVFDISAPPTSPDCVVFAICCLFYRHKISLCNRKDDAWTTKEYERKGKGPVVHVVFVNGIWYCLYQYGDISSFDAVSCSWKYLGTPMGMMWTNVNRHVSFVIRRGDEVFLRIHGLWFCEIALKDPLEVTRSSDDNCIDDLEFSFRIDLKTAIGRLQNVLVMDSFSTDAWCGKCDLQGNLTFIWHDFKSWQDMFLPSDHPSCFEDSKQCSPNIVWFEPIWVNPSPNLCWSL